MLGVVLVLLLVLVLGLVIALVLVLVLPALSVLALVLGLAAVLGLGLVLEIRLSLPQSCKLLTITIAPTVTLSTCRFVAVVIVFLIAIAADQTSRHPFILMAMKAFEAGFAV